MRRYSYFEIEDKLYKETYEKLEENYALDQKEFNIGQNDAEIQRVDAKKKKKAYSMVN